uniref:Testis-expressed sequence 10 protein homolog n=1 Tax=Cacopsylla melanoneura TaxID=428564 RepID=A0A8D8RUF7_9HEMI
MVKTGHKKFVKKEKARVKLKKSYKTILPKGLNVTNTEFKVKRIVIREQLKERGENELLSAHRKLNVKELMSRLKHNNSAVKQDGLSGLFEIVTLNATSLIKSHFSSIVDSVSSLMLDISGNTRKAVVKLLSAMFSQVTEEELSPLFEIIVRYLACAMSHMDSGVREDSLLIIDILLEQCPLLTAKHRSLLPHFLDMISSQTRSHEQARQLTVDLDSRTTTTVFRIKVLTRLRSMLQAIVHSSKTKPGQSNANREVTVSSDTRHVPLYSSQQHAQPFVYDKKVTSNQTLADVQSYTQMLMPLLMDTFIEVVADRKQAGSDIVVEAVALLQCVVDVILNVIHILRQCDTGGVAWFKQTYGRSLRDHLFTGRFPYTVGSWGSLPNKNAKQRRKDCEAALKLLNTSLDLQCTGQNLSLCLLAFQLGIDSPVNLDYVLTSIKCCRSLNPTILACLDAIVSKSDLSQCITVTETLLSLARDPGLTFVVFPYLYNIVIRVDVKKLAKKTRVEDWLDTLPTYLCQKTPIPGSVINSIMTLAARRIPALQNSIDSHIEHILDALPELEIKECERNSEPELSYKRSLARLIYWVQEWDEELSEEICLALRKQHFGPLTPYVEDLWLLRNETFEK